MGKHLLIGCLLLIAGNYMVAQNIPRTSSNKALKHYNDGKQHYGFYAFDDAISELRQAIKTDSEFIDAHLLLAEICFDVKNYPLAIESYRNVVRIDVDFFPMAMFNLAHLERLSGFYESAKDHFEQFLAMDSGNEKRRAEAVMGINNCEFSIEALKNPVPFNPKNLGSAINSEYDEYWPSITADGLTLVVTVQIPKKTRSTGMGLNMQEDFFISRYENGQWLPKKNMGKPINSELNEGAQSLSADGHFMFYTACNRPDGLGSCDIYYSSWLGDGWSLPRNIGKPINTSSWDAHPSISPDGKTLYFCSRRPGGKGSIDLWRSTLTEDGYWGEAENLGDKINTPGDEMSPFIHPDNQTLYFSSNGLPGLGDFDLFVTRMNGKGEWEEPKNLGFPINTHGEEMGLIVNAKGNKAYFSSTRLTNAGKDIFEFELISLLSKEIIMEAYSDPRGEFLVCIPTNQDYALNVSREGYLFYSDNFSLSGMREITDPFLKDVPLQPIMTGKSIILKNIFYETDSYFLLPKSEAELDKVIQFLEKNPDIRVEISGHTDNVGTAEYNQTLSENRAKSVYKYLVDHQIDPGRLVFRGYGLSRPIDSNESDAGRAMNRRTELKIL